MALETVVFQPDPYSHISTEFTGLLFPSFDVLDSHISSGNDTSGLGFLTNYDPFIEFSTASPPVAVQIQETSGLSYSHSYYSSDIPDHRSRPPAEARRMRPKKRRRITSVKEQEEIASQRMAHIAMERNRRKIMNQHLAVLRSILPPSHVQRGDQASIVTGAINFVKELEHILQSLQAHKSHRTTLQSSTSGAVFSDFFVFPQYTSSSVSSPGIADIEVAMVESHVRIRVLTKRQSRQLSKMLSGLKDLGLTTLHLNLTAAQDMALHSFSVKVEGDCQLGSVNEIADAVHEMVRKIQDEGD